jgi:flagellar biogenesis protein FliO
MPFAFVPQVFNGLAKLDSPVHPTQEFSVISYLIVVGIFIFLAWFVTKTLGDKLTATRHGKLIKYVDSSAITVDKKIFIVEVQGTHYIILSDKNGSALIDKRNDIDIESLKSNGTGNYGGSSFLGSSNFSTILNKYYKKNKDK